jgi:hypothetical protein
MNTGAIREQLHQYIEQANDKKIQGLFLLVEDEINQFSSFQLSKEEIATLSRERNRHLNKESPSYDWEEAKKIIRNNRK